MSIFPEAHYISTVNISKLPDHATIETFGQVCLILIQFSNYQYQLPYTARICERNNLQSADDGGPGLRLNALPADIRVSQSAIRDYLVVLYHFGSCLLHRAVCEIRATV